MGIALNSIYCITKWGACATSSSWEDELATETRYVRGLHQLLAAELDVVSGRTTAALSAQTGTELSARWERDVAVHRWSERAAQLRAARAGLCFGRLDAHREEPVLHRPDLGHRRRPHAARGRLAGAGRPEPLPLRHRGGSRWASPAAGTSRPMAG